ncbi:hypothetical protein [Enterobacter roggenkampii]|uniref:hypothetical protein n=1 Tax=Enterobacter roggenkampii TaxID=1812935 RepID=UPI0032199252
MIGLVVIIICVIVSVFGYKKIASSCRNKGRGSVRTFFTASISSIFLFIITMGIGVANFFPRDKISDIVDVPKVPMIKWSTTENMEEINALIEKDLKENPELTRKILKDISSYKEGSLERTVAELNYTMYGVGIKEYEPILKNTPCFIDLKSGMQRANSVYANETRNWQSLSNFKRNVGGGTILQAEIDYRERFNKETMTTLKVLQDRSEVCEYNTAQSMKNHLTRQRPVSD